MSELGSINKLNVQEEAAGGSSDCSAFLESHTIHKGELETWLDITDDGRVYLVGDRAAQIEESITSLKGLMADMHNLELEHPERATLQQRIRTGIATIYNCDSARVNELTATEISVSGLELLEDTGIEEPVVWLAERIQRHPEELVRGVGMINFKEGLERPDIRGLCYIAEGSIEISAVVSDTLKEYHKDILGSVVDHELAHHAHSQCLPLDALSAYNNIVREEAIDPDFYAPHPDDLEDKTAALMEDFATSVEYYFNHPALLMNLQPLRFVYCQEIYRHYTSEVIAESQGDAYAHGITDAELKAIADQHVIPRDIPIRPA